jgi:hypothetical protein
MLERLFFRRAALDKPSPASDDFEDTARIRALAWDAVIAGDTPKARALIEARLAPLPTDDPPPAWRATLEERFARTGKF